MFKLREKNRKWWILFAMTSCISMIFIDSTVLPVSLPTIQKTLNFSSLGLQWIVNVYALAITIFVLAAGKFGDGFGHKKIFLWGLFVFSVSSILCAMSESEWWFITARALQGIGGAMLIPTAAALVYEAFPPDQKGKALGFYISIGSVFLAIGPFVGGIFSEYLTWHFIFWINPPIAFIGMLLTLFSVPKSETKPLDFDFLGFLTSTIGITTIITALMQVSEWGWTSPLTLGMILFGIALLFILFIVDRQEKKPYLDINLFKNRNFSGALLSIFIAQFFLMAYVYWPIYFQDVFKFSPLKAGLLLLCSNFPVIIAAPLGGHLLDRRGPLLPMALGFTLIGLSFFWFLQNLDNSNVWIILSAIIPLGFGVPFVLTPSYTTAMSVVLHTKRGTASGTATMIRQAGATLGLAVLTSIYLTTQMQNFEEDLQKNKLTQSLNSKPFAGLLADNPDAIRNLKQLPLQSRHYVIKSLENATYKGFYAINVVALLATITGLSASLLLIRKKTQPQI